jgi:flagellar biosynthesis GTPase FlhF
MKRIRVLSAAFLLLAVGGNAAVYAQGRGQEKQKPKQEQKKQPEKQVPPQEQQQRAQQEQQRAAQYKQRLDAQVAAAQQQAAQLAAQKRAAQATAQEQYAAALRQQQQRLQAPRDYSHDPYVTTPHTYRYVIGGNTRQTNQYGADVLRQAVNDGYQQGYRAGQADRQDRRRSSYQATFGYRDANYGYDGRYVDQSDYNYYFRQGFRRGYEDGFNSQYRYGRSENGTPVILAALLITILGLKAMQ